MKRDASGRALQPLAKAKHVLVRVGESPILLRIAAINGDAIVAERHLVELGQPVAFDHAVEMGAGGVPSFRYIMSEL
nr:hypothetical protein [uncultured bacterium]